MINKELRRKLPPDSIVLDDDSYDNSIIGITLDGRIIYDYDLMVEELMQDDDCSMEEAIDWIEYNTLRAIPYIGNKALVIVNSYTM